MTYIPEASGFYNPDKLPIGTYVPYVSTEELVKPRPDEMWKEAGEVVDIKNNSYICDLYKNQPKSANGMTLPVFGENSLMSIENDITVDFDENDWVTEDVYRYVYTDALIGTKSINLKTSSKSFVKSYTDDAATITSSDFPTNEEWWIHEVAQFVDVKLILPGEEDIMINSPNDITLSFGEMEYDDPWYTGRSYLFYNPDTRMHKVVLCYAAGRRKLTRTTTNNEKTTSFSSAFSGRGDGGLYINTTEYLSEVVPLRGKYAKLTNFGWIKRSPLLTDYDFQVEDYQEKES